MPPKKADQPKKKQATVDDKVSNNPRGPLLDRKPLFWIYADCERFTSLDLWHEKCTSIEYGIPSLQLATSPLDSSTLIT